AQRLRRETTGPERALWSALRNKKVSGLRFRRQHPIGPYIVDFFCASHAIAVEIDGMSHAYQDRTAHDRRREEWLRAHGVRVLRFTNDDVVRDPAKVAEAIQRVLRGG